MTDAGQVRIEIHTYVCTYVHVYICINPHSYETCFVCCDLVYNKFISDKLLNALKLNESYLCVCVFFSEIIKPMVINLFFLFKKIT